VTAVPAILARLSALDARIERRGDGLVVCAGRAPVPKALIEEARAAKAELSKMLIGPLRAEDDEHLRCSDASKAAETPVSAEDAHLSNFDEHLRTKPPVCSAEDAHPDETMSTFERREESCRFQRDPPSKMLIDPSPRENEHLRRESVSLRASEGARVEDALAGPIEGDEHPGAKAPRGIEEAHPDPAIGAGVDDGHRQAGQAIPAAEEAYADEDDEHRRAGIEDARRHKDDEHLPDRRVEDAHPKRADEHLQGEPGFLRLSEASAAEDAHGLEPPPARARARDNRSECQGHANIENSRGIPHAWVEGIARLDPNRPPADVPARRWRTFIHDCRRFFDSGFAAQAAKLGWGPLDLFGCDRDRPFARIDQGGLLWVLNGYRLIAASENTGTIETRTGVRQTWRRKPGEPGRVLAWELA
jgi:hypothetical protein